LTWVATQTLGAEELATSNAVSSDAATPVEVKVSVQADDTKVKEVLDSLATQSKAKILVESSVRGTLRLSLNDVSLEPALSALCEFAKLQWRKIYISPKSALLEQPDRFAATVRLMSGLSFPDMVLAGSSIKKVGVHFEDKQAVKSAEDAAVDKLDMKPVYLITNDSAVAAKAAKSKKESEKSSVDEYTDLTKKQMEKFMEMTPEEREQAIIESLNMMDQVDPGYMAMATRAMMNADPATWERIQRRGSEMIFSMSAEDRRHFLKMNMKMQKDMFTPEQMEILKEDTQAIMEELRESEQQ
jgi:hypothetical protein